jgi:hypothetical protein
MVDAIKQERGARMQDQLLISGIVTEADVLKRYFVERARKAGRTKSPAKSAAARRNALKGLAAIRAKREQKRKEDPA